jgi:hypothetical protein
VEQQVIKQACRFRESIRVDTEHVPDWGSRKSAYPVRHSGGRSPAAPQQRDQPAPARSLASVDRSFGPLRPRKPSSCLSLGDLASVHPWQGCPSLNPGVFGACISDRLACCPTTTFCSPGFFADISHSGAAPSRHAASRL